MAHVSEKKKDLVAEFAQLIDKYDYIGAVDMENLPAKQLNNMRTQLRGSVLIRMSKRRLLTVALEESKKEKIADLVPYLKGMPALLFTNESPFKLFKTLKKNKSFTAIKGGQIAPNEIVVPAGPTSFAPGPIIGELGSVGIKAGIDAGKVAIKADTVVAKEGDVVSTELAAILTRLGIEPMEIGLELTAIYENGDILTKAVLDIDEEVYINDIGTAASWAFNLAVEAAYPCADTIETLLMKASMESKNLAINEDILTDLTVGDTLVKAQNQMLAVAGLLSDDALSDELKGAAASAQANDNDMLSSEATGTQKPEVSSEKEEPKADAAAGLGALFG